MAGCLCYKCFNGGLWTNIEVRLDDSHLGEILLQHGRTLLWVEFDNVYCF
jgi:hypothetical protein